MTSASRCVLALYLSIFATTAHGYSQSEALTAVGGSREGLLSLVTDPGAYNVSIPANLTSSPGSNYLVDGIRAFQFFYPLVGDSASFWYGFAKKANGTNKFASSGYLSNATSTNGGTPNTDTVYGSSVIDLTQGPILLYVPPFGSSLKFWSLTLYDYYQNVVHVLGSVQHSQSGATYLILQKGQLHKWLKVHNKPKIAGLLYVQYNYTILFTRLLVNTPSDLTVIHQLDTQQKITLYDGRQPRYFLPPVVNATLRAGPLDPNNTVGGNLDFFSTAGTLLQYHGLPVKGSGIDQILKRLHINPVDGFNPSALNPLQKYALVWAVNLGFSILSAKSLQPYPVNYPPWSVDLDWGVYGNNDLANSFVERYFPIANLPAQTVYYYARTDSNGNALTGAKGAWNITIPINLPYNSATAFWSLIVYTYPNGALINNPLNRYEFGDRSQNIFYNADKSYTIYLSGTAPTNPNQYANWLPAGNGTVELVLRLYEPTTLVLDGLYAPPAIIPV